MMAVDLSTASVVATFGVQQSLYAQVLFCLAKGVFQSVNRRRLLLHRAPIKQLRPGEKREKTFPGLIFGTFTPAK